MTMMMLIIVVVVVIIIIIIINTVDPCYNMDFGKQLKQAVVSYLGYIHFGIPDITYIYPATKIHVV
jgi:hypothetical protein